MKIKFTKWLAVVVLMQSSVILAQTPTVTTTDFSGLTPIQVTLGGNVTNQGGSSVTDRGIVYSTKNSNPKIGGEGVTTMSIGSGTGSYSNNLTGLTGVTGNGVTVKLIVAFGSSPAR